jgi:hypothetical protein
VGCSGIFFVGGIFMAFEIEFYSSEDGIFKVE